MKMTGCSEEKRQDIRNYLEIHLSLKYCQVKCLKKFISEHHDTCPVFGMA